jgi:hypothetical protein
LEARVKELESAVAARDNLHYEWMDHLPYEFNDAYAAIESPLAKKEKP